MPPSKRIENPVKHGEDFLDVEAITLTMENGEVVTLRPKDELKIPTDPDLLRKAAITGPSRLAFWDYQTERCLRVVRDQERDLERIEGEAGLVMRKFLEQEGEVRNESVIRDRLAIDDKVVEARKKLNSAKESYGVLRATTDAVRHRMYVLTKLLTNDANATRG